MNKTDTNWGKKFNNGGSIIKPAPVTESVESNDPTISTMLHKARVESIR